MVKVGDTVKVKYLYKKGGLDTQIETRWKGAVVIDVKEGKEITVRFGNGLEKWFDWDDNSWSVE